MSCATEQPTSFSMIVNFLDQLIEVSETQQGVMSTIANTSFDLFRNYLNSKTSEDQIHFASIFYGWFRKNKDFVLTRDSQLFTQPINTNEHTTEMANIMSVCQHLPYFFQIYSDENKNIIWKWLEYFASN